MLRSANKRLPVGRGKWLVILMTALALASILTATIVIARTLRRAPALSNQRTEVEIVTVRPWGFEPKEISRQPGPFFLAVDNHSELDQIDVSLDVEAGPKLHGVGVSKNKPRWRQKMTLAPGAYVLREASHPAWTCRITVQP